MVDSHFMFNKPVAFVILAPMILLYQQTSKPTEADNLESVQNSDHTTDSLLWLARPTSTETLPSARVCLSSMSLDTWERCGKPFMDKNLISNVNETRNPVRTDSLPPFCRFLERKLAAVRENGLACWLPI